jgi:hypothetical protein
MLTHIISGGQTGADRAGLDAALALGLQTGGWLPKGRRTEAGPLPITDMRRYRLREHPLADYTARTRQNILDSDGTVIFGDALSPGSRLTFKLCRELGKPVLGNPTAESLRAWVLREHIAVLNVAGNRLSVNPLIYQQTYDCLLKAFGPR